jgi:hypothetical protein
MASMCRQPPRRDRRNDHDGINRALENPDVQCQLSIADIPGKPMPLSELASLMKADYEKLTTVVKASGMTAP